jgi:hypothetical protein
MIDFVGDRLLTRSCEVRNAFAAFEDVYYSN